MRVRYAGIGYSYNEELDAFVPPQPYASWVLNNETADWEAPVGPAPALTEAEVEARSFYRWDEEGGAWVLEITSSTCRGVISRTVPPQAGFYVVE
jgi:hypothetical protein